MPPLNKAVPLYLQITDIVKSKIISGFYAPGSKMPSIRDMALEYEVTPNTIQRALQILEQDGLICTERTNGKFVTTQVSCIKQIRNEQLSTIVRQVITDLYMHGYSKEEIEECMIKELSKEHEE